MRKEKAEAPPLPDIYDAVVVGAGVFGAWTAYHLRKFGRSVALFDQYGPANSRASSGDESRILRMGYGPAGIYTRWAQRSRRLWMELFEQVEQPDLFLQTGALWTPPPGDRRAAETRATFEKCGVMFEELNSAQLERRYAQFRFTSERMGIFEPEAGVLLARKAVTQVVAEAMRNGVEYFREAASAPERGRITTSSGAGIAAGIFVYACGPWLPKIFPELLAGRIRPTRQEVFYFGTPPGDRRFAPPLMPAWIDFGDERCPYVLPEVESRGFKVAFDRHGPDFDPDTGDRLASGVDAARAFLAERFPALAQAPLVESRVCQYENTSNGDFLIDRHPDFEHVWLAGGGSGHGFKHGPAVGEYVTKLIDGKAASEPLFSLAKKTLERSRSVY
ncbi:MAG TPA: FAD-dependent oxidoreductase [Bryobacteraceae bacterium]|nr:FAD-dependent oxidoreductase [Bryobacteraceae bacterium]